MLWGREFGPTSNPADDRRAREVEDRHRAAVGVLGAVLADEDGPAVRRHRELVRSPSDLDPRRFAAGVEVDERHAIPALVGHDQRTDEGRENEATGDQYTTLYATTWALPCSTLRP